MKSFSVVSLLLAYLTSAAVAFAPTSPISSAAAKPSSTTSLSVKFDKSTGRWIAQTEDEKTGGYDAFGSLIRFGPKPVLIRLLNPDDYDQGVLKMMAAEKWDKQEAMGNFDAYLENPNDWAFQKNEEKKGGFKKDYGKMPSTKQLGLNAVWSGIVVWFFYDLISGVVGGKYPFEPLFKF